MLSRWRDMSRFVSRYITISQSLTEACQRKYLFHTILGSPPLQAHNMLFYYIGIEMLIFYQRHRTRGPPMQDRAGKHEIQCACDLSHWGVAAPRHLFAATAVCG